LPLGKSLGAWCTAVTLLSGKWRRKSLPALSASFSNHKQMVFFWYRIHAIIFTAASRPFAKNRASFMKGAVPKIFFRSTLEIAIALYKTREL